MPCNHPMPARQAAPGLKPILGMPPTGTEVLSLPCRKCSGCRKAKAKEWALRNHLELHDHDHASFATLTYDEKRVPPTLSKRDWQLFIKRFRKQLDSPMGPTPIVRYFMSGEYGETTGRPHYHAILYGVNPITYRDLIQKTWGRGLTHTVEVTPASINYVAGYTSKKAGENYAHIRRGQERIDPETGEIYHYQPPFILMSRGGRQGHGIGGNARQYVNSWKHYAVHNSAKMPVPRYYHAAWREQATQEEIEQLATEKRERVKQMQVTLQQLDSQERILEAMQAISAAKRTKI